MGVRLDIFTTKYQNLSPNTDSPKNTPSKLFGWVYQSCQDSKTAILSSMRIPLDTQDGTQSFSREIAIDTLRTPQ